MFLKTFKMQMEVMARKKTVVFTLFVIYVFVLVNFWCNMMEYKNIEFVSQMQDPIKMLTLSSWSISGYFMMQFYPILLAIPTATAYFEDKETKIKVYVESKTGKKVYWYSKALSVFVITFLVFTIPFLIEIFMEVCSFNMNANGDPTGFAYIQTIESDSQHLFSSLFLKNKIFYAIIMTLVFGLVTSILALFNFSVTVLPFVKYKIFAFLPVYVLLYVITLIQQLTSVEYTLNYFFILRMFDTEAKNYMVYFSFLLLLLIASLSIIHVKIKRDDLL